MTEPHGFQSGAVFHRGLTTHELHVEQEVIHGKCREFKTESPIISQTTAR